MKKLFLSSELDSNNTVMNYLGYEETSRRYIFHNKYVIVNYKEGNNTKEDKKLIIRSHIPFPFLMIFLGIAFILATIFLILNLTYLDETNKISFFFMLMVPAFVFIIIGTLFSLMRYFNSIHNLESVSYIMSKIKKGDNK